MTLIRKNLDLVAIALGPALVIGSFLVGLFAYVGEGTPWAFVAFGIGIALVAGLVSAATAWAEGKPMPDVSAVRAMTAHLDAPVRRTDFSGLPVYGPDEDAPVRKYSLVDGVLVLDREFRYRRELVRWCGCLVSSVQSNDVLVPMTGHRVERCCEDFHPDLIVALTEFRAATRTISA
jgi:hypothetical protein